MVNDFFEKEYTYSEIIENLKNNDADDFVKIFSVINLEILKIPMILNCYCII